MDEKKNPWTITRENLFMIILDQVTEYKVINPMPLKVINGKVILKTSIGLCSWIKIEYIFLRNSVFLKHIDESMRFSRLEKGIAGCKTRTVRRDRTESGSTEKYR